MGVVVSDNRQIRLRSDVEIADAEIAPNDREVRIEYGRSLPQSDGLVMETFVIEQIGEIVGRLGIGGVGVYRRAQNQDLLDT